MTLNQLKKGQSGRIASIVMGGSGAARVSAMGLVPGAHVRIVGVAPLGDPILIETEGCRLCLRRSEAESLAIEIEAPSLGV